MDKFTTRVATRFIRNFRAWSSDWFVATLEKSHQLLWVLSDFDVNAATMIVYAAYALVNVAIIMLIAGVHPLLAFLYHGGMMVFGNRNYTSIFFLFVHSFVRVLRALTAAKKEERMPGLSDYFKQERLAHRYWESKTPYRSVYLDFACQLVLIGLIIAFRDSSIQYVFAPTFLTLILQMIPGAGGNSSRSNIMYLLMIILCLPMGRDAFLTFSTEVRGVYNDWRAVGAPQTRVDIGAAAAGALHLTSGRWTWWIEAESIIDIIRLGMGFVPIIWLMIDDMKGPGIGIRVMHGLMKKGVSTLDEPIGASIATSCWWWLGIADFVISICANLVTRVLVMLVMAPVVWYAWHAVGAKHWGGEATFAGGTGGRPGARICPGSGVKGSRIAMIRCCLVVSSLLMMNEGIPWGIFGLVISWLTAADEGFTTVALGLVTANPLLVAIGFTRRPITGSYQANAVAANADE